MINIANSRLIAPLLGAALLVGCGQEIADNTRGKMSFETNATYVAVQDGPTGPWQMKINDNKSNGLSQTSLVLKDPGKRFGIVFVCPGVDDTSAEGFSTVKANLATAYFATADELSQISFLCRQVVEAKAVGKMYGSIKPDSTLAEGHEDTPSYVDVAIGETISLRALEAYATEATEDTHDVLAMTGPVNDDDEIEPVAFYSGSGSAFAGKKTSAAASNIQFNANASSTTLVDPKVQTTAVTVAGVADLAADEQWLARVGFVGQNRGYLLLKESRNPSFEFLRVPANRIGTGLVVSRNKFISDKQAHEFVIRVVKKIPVVGGKDGETKDVEQRAFYHFFQDQTSISAALPAKPTTTPQVEVSSNAVRAVVRANWGSYDDSIAGPGTVYRFEASGFAIPPVVKAPEPAPPAKPLVWTSYVTRNWAGRDDVSFVLPDLSAAQEWKDTWDFKKNTPITWNHHSYASKNRAGLIIDYLVNRKAVDKLDFAVVHQSGSAVSQ